MNTLFVATFTYGRGSRGGRCPDSRCRIGKQAYDTDTFKGGATQVNPQYYRDTVLQVCAPDLGDFDVLEAVLPAALARAKTICWFEDVFRCVPNVAAQEKRSAGEMPARCASTARITATFCWGR